jgi:hypothetical protein
LPPVALRLGILAVCVVAIAVLAGRLADHNGCQDARRSVFAAAGGAAVGPRALAADARTLRADCHDVDDLSAGAVGLLVAGRGADALGLAREATRRGPEVFSAWAALEAAERRVDPAAARRAAARARALNPRWAGPAPLPAPRGGAGP